MCIWAPSSATKQGLDLALLRNAQTMSLAGIEKKVKRPAVAKKDGNWKLNDVSGGTFTITNGGQGVFCRVQCLHFERLTAHRLSPSSLRYP
jgi:pyruvate/2-oxoglutarate dehydrogenase complex dihydrolipoamide acyltransferase (E2) component